jgi:hypothetical protein
MESSDDDYGEEEEEMEGRAVKIPPPVFFLKDIGIHLTEKFNAAF